jgi:hypothetical protein
MQSHDQAQVKTQDNQRKHLLRHAVHPNKYQRSKTPLKSADHGANSDPSSGRLQNKKVKRQYKQARTAAHLRASSW